MPFDPICVAILHRNIKDIIPSSSRNHRDGNL